MPIRVNDNGTWRPVIGVWVNDNGTWRPISKVHVRDATAWREAYTSVDPNIWTGMVNNITFTFFGSSGRWAGTLAKSSGSATLSNFQYSIVYDTGVETEVLVFSAELPGAPATLSVTFGGVNKIMTRTQAGVYVNQTGVTWNWASWEGTNQSLSIVL